MKEVALPVDVALERVKKITPMLRTDVETAIASFALMEATNEIVPKGLIGFESRFAVSYAVSQQALALKVSMDLARVFDLSRTRPLQSQDKASIPVLGALLERLDLQEALLVKAENWRAEFEHGSLISDPAHQQALEEAMETLAAEDRAVDRQTCRNAIDSFLTSAARLEIEGSDSKSALVRLRQFRDRRLAHSLFDKEPEKFPSYSDLSLLLEIAKVAARAASLAVDGQPKDYDDLSTDAHKDATGYATCVLDGLQRDAVRR